MTLIKDLTSNHIPHSCEQCKNCNCCRSDVPCYGFVPKNMQTFLDETINKLKENTPISKGTKMYKRGRKSKYVSDDGVTPLNDYYIELINDTLYLIRRRLPAYVFTLGQVKDVLRYERDINITYHDYYYEINSNR